MLISWFRLDVTAAERPRFDTGMKLWSSLQEAEGFLGRLGGWDQEGRACVFTLWRDVGALRLFRRRQSAALLERTGLGPWFEGRMPGLIEVLLPIPGLCTTTASLLQRGRMLRMVSAQADPREELRILEEQASVWKPALSRSPGMLGAYFGSSVEEPGHYFGASIWASKEDLRRWSEEGYRACIEAARRLEFQPAREGLKVTLDPEWTVQRPSWNRQAAG